MEKIELEASDLRVWLNHPITEALREKYAQIIDHQIRSLTECHLGAIRDPGFIIDTAIKHCIKQTTEDYLKTITHINRLQDLIDMYNEDCAEDVSHYDH